MHSWLFPNLGPFLVPLAAALGLLWLPWGRLVWELLAHPTRRKLLAALVLIPSGWLVIETVRSWDALGGPWGLLGASQWNFRPTLAAASLGGVWLVSFLIVTVNVAFAIALMPPTSRGVRRIAVGVICSVLTIGPAWYALQPSLDATRVARVAIIQPGIVKGSHTDVDAGELRSESLTRTIAGSDVDLVVWGESSFDYDFSERPDLLARLEELSREVGAPILVNQDARRAAGGGTYHYKTAVLITPTGIAGTYDKIRLIPLGEYIPFRFALGWIARFSEAAKENVRRGHQLAVFDANGLRIGPLVCFESAFPDMSRNLANRGADLIVVQSSTSTFQDSWAPAQQASLAAVRAVESGRTVVHAALTGDSVAFDARGRRLGLLDTHRSGVLTVSVPISHDVTPFDRAGDWVIAGSVIALTAAAVVTGVRRGRTASRRRAVEDTRDEDLRLS